VDLSPLIIDFAVEPYGGFSPPTPYLGKIQIVHGLGSGRFVVHLSVISGLATEASIDDRHILLKRGIHDVISHSLLSNQRAHLLR